MRIKATVEKDINHRNAMNEVTEALLVFWIARIVHPLYVDASGLKQRLIYVVLGSRTA